MRTPIPSRTQLERQARNRIPAGQLHDLLHCDPVTGKLFWRPRPVHLFVDLRACAAWNARYAGKEALSAPHKRGYRVGSILGADYTAHRVIWAMVYGEWPKADVDHIDMNKANNAIANLRLANRAQNMANTGPRATNKAGLKGVYRHYNGKGWRAQISVGGKRRHLGVFSTKEAAATAYADALRAAHGEFARAGAS